MLSDWTIKTLKEYLIKHKIYFYSKHKKHDLYELMMKHKKENKLSQMSEETVSDIPLSQMSEETVSFIDTWMNWIEKIQNDTIILLRNRNVIQWLLNDISYLNVSSSSSKKHRNQLLKSAEDEWGKQLMHTKRPELRFEKQWTNRFGEDLGFEINSLLNQSYTRPRQIGHYKPDGETHDTIWEIKTGTYFTDGTAHEKIIGVPFKYIEIPDLYQKPLKILCIGGAEIKARHYELIDCHTAKKQHLLDIYKNQYQIEYVAFTDMMKQVSTIHSVKHIQ